MFIFTMYILIHCLQKLGKPTKHVANKSAYKRISQTLGCKAKGRIAMIFCENIKQVFDIFIFAGGFMYENRDSNTHGFTSVDFFRFLD